MLRKIVPIVVVLALAFGILGISLFTCAEAKYSFNVKNTNSLPTEKPKAVDYFFPYTGRIQPDNSLWYFKAFRDKLWYGLTFNSGKKAELLLLFADKRLILARDLFIKGKPEIAFSTLTKAEKYLEEAYLKEEENRKGGQDTASFLVKLATAALKHREVIRGIIEIAPDDAKPEIFKVENYPKNIYKALRDTLNSKGVLAPENPFED